MSESTNVPAGVKPNKVKHALADGGYAFGTWVMTNRNPAITRIIAAAGFDFVFIDTEHSDLSWETVGTMCEMARASDLAPIVRPYDRGGHLANRVQDLGAMGLMYHDVTTRDQVDDLLHWMRYPPTGVRGSTSLAAPMDYYSGSGADLKRFIDENMMLVIQIESREGVENASSILAGGGVDVVEIGRGDLSTSYGVPLDIRNPIVLDAVDEVIAACNEHGVAPGVNCVSLEDADDMMKRGVRCVSYSTDRRILSNVYQDALRGLKELAPSEHAARR